MSNWKSLFYFNFEVLREFLIKSFIFTMGQCKKNNLLWLFWVTESQYFYVNCGGKL